MGTLLKNKVLFLHVPKTGGTWSRNVFRDQNLVKMEFPDTHSDMVRLRNLSRFYPLHYLKQSLKKMSFNAHKDIEKSFKFCFVRNPYKWYESYWRYMKGRSWSIPQDVNTYPDTTWKVNEKLLEYGGDGFHRFVEGVMKNYPGYLTQMYGWYAPPGEIDFVGRTESLVDDLLEALDRAGIDVDEAAVRNTEKVNTSPSRIDRPEWHDDLRAAVRRLEAPVFERFGYE